MVIQRTWNRILPLALLLAILLVALIPRGVVYAQDGEPPIPPTEGAATEEQVVETPLAEDTSAEVPAELETPAADPASTESETVASAEAALEAEAPEADTLEIPPGLAADPYLFIGGTIQNFTTIQGAIDYLSANDATPDGNTVYVEDGNFGEDPLIDGNNWSGGTTTPLELILQSVNGSGWTTITGSLTIQNMLNFFLNGFTVTDGVVASGNTGTLTVEDLVVSGTPGDGLTVTGQDGEVVLQNVEANSNAGVGALIDNTAGSAGVTISDSSFHDNNTVAAGGQQGGLQVFSDGEVVLENVQASGNLDGDGAWLVGDGITVTGSAFNDNSSPLAGWGFGLVAESQGGPISLSGVMANGNEESGAALWFLGSDPVNSIHVGFSQFKNNDQFGVWAQPESGVVTFRCVKFGGNALGPTMVPVGETVNTQGCPPPYHEKTKAEYVGVKLSPDEPKIVNAGNGVLVTIPPVVILDDELMARAKVWPLLEKQLPKELLPEDQFLAGVKIELINAEIPESSEDPEANLIKLEFHIPAYRMESTFAALWWDEEAEEWVELEFSIEPHDRLPGGKVVVEWPEPGIFVLVLREPANGS